MNFEGGKFAKKKGGGEEGDTKKRITTLKNTESTGCESGGVIWIVGRVGGLDRTVKRKGKS